MNHAENHQKKNGVTSEDRPRSIAWMIPTEPRNTGKETALGRKSAAACSSGFQEWIAFDDIDKARRPRRRVPIGKRNQILRFGLFLRALRRFLELVFRIDGLNEACEEKR
jgi:hypothetical protein